MKRCSKCQEIKPLEEFYSCERTQRCKKCRNATARVWYAANREKRIAQTGVYNKTHPQVVSKARTKFNATEYAHQYFAQWQKRFRAEQPERVLEIERRRNQKESRKQQFRLKSYRRRAQTKGSFDETQFKDKWILYGERCAYCLKPLPLSQATRDHKKPLILNGLNFISNIAPACRSCNSKKGAKYEIPLATST